MASELEGLIATLLVLISCGGEQGCSVSDVVDAIHNPTRAQQSTAGDAPLLGDGSGFRHRTASTIWRWLAARRDVSVGPDRGYNHLSLDEVLALSPPPSNPDPNGADPTSESNTDIRQTAHHVRVSVSEETMWESLTGHAIDYKRVPRSEWLLLLGIASTTFYGILQGDLGRLVDQDKRSVPKRTDALLKKGYIAKRTTLVRGTKTSKMWLKMFAPSLAKDGDDDEPRADMNLTHQFLVASLDPVPWHVRWTGESVDYTALATTILAVAKEWGVLRMQDLKSKLGVLGMRWQMKVLAKVCRFLNSRGVIQYVAAKLGDKVFKDCIKYGRDLNPEDWSIFLATGKRATKPSRHPDLAAGDTVDRQPSSGLPTNLSEVSSSPPWSLDKPISVAIAEMAQRLGDKGLNNPDAYGSTLGASFSRYLSSMTSALATPNLQPRNLKHFQLRSEHTRVGKIASYRYFAPQTTSPAPDTTEGPEAPEATQQEDSSVAASSLDSSYGFAPISVSAMTTTPMAAFTDLCTKGPGIRKPKGRPRKQQEAKKIGRPKQDADAIQEQPQELPQHHDPPQDDSPPQDTEARQETSTLVDDIQQEANNKAQEPDGTSKVVTLKVRPSELKFLLEQSMDDTPSRQRTRTRARASPEDSAPDTTLRTRRTRSQLEKPAVDSPSRPRRTRKTRAAVVNEGDVESDLPVTEEVDATRADTTEVDGTEADAADAGKDSTSKKKRGRKGKGKGVQGDGAAAKPWKCEKCGGTWKNDIGLKYHQEKSRTSCNPSYDENAEPTPRRNRQRALSEAEDKAIQAPAASEAPQDGKSATEEQDELQDEDPVEEPTPAPLRSRRRTVATPKVLSRPSVSLTGGPLQAIPEWRRPSVNSFDSPEKSPVPSNSGGALVQSQAGQLRPALGLSDGRKSGSGTSKLASNKKQREQDKPSTDEIHSKGAQTNGDAKDETGSTGSPGIKPLQSKVVDSLVPKVAVNNRLCEIITELLEEQNGVFPAGRGLWHAMTIRWGEKFPTDGPAPTTRSYQIVLREMTKKKVVAEHLHGFRDSKGFFCKCQMILFGTKDPFSQDAMDLVERSKEVYPATYIPPPFSPLPTTGTIKDLRRGRRHLGEEVETLSAPVYAAQAAAKRVLNDHDELEGTPRPKRRKVKTTNASSSSTSLKKRYVSWADIDQSDYIAPPVWTGSSEYLLNQRPMEGIEFLDPNTFLQEEPTVKHQKRLGSSRDIESEECVIDPQLMSADSAACIVFDKIIPLVGNRGTWRYMSALDFETQGGSYALEGWMPDANWFSWAEIVEEIDRRTNTIGRLRRRTEPNTSPYHRFKDRLTACLEVERAWTDSFISAPPYSTGPHNIFIKFFVGRENPVLVPSEPISWPEEGQLNPESYVLLTPEEEEEGNDHSSSSEDEDPFEWPKLCLPITKPVKPNAIVGEAPIRVDPLPRSNIKRVRLAARALTALPPATQNTEDTQETTATEDEIEDADKLLAAFVAVRVLLGGADKAVDWGLLLKLFPKLGVTQLRRFWLSARKEQGAYVAKLTQDFQDKFLVAYEKDELPEIDFDDILECDWQGIISWTMRLRRREAIQLPLTREELKEQCTSQDVPPSEDDWREKFHHPQSSVFSRFESSTAAPAAVPVHKRNVKVTSRTEMTNLDIAKSWIRSLCCTDETRYSPFLIKEKFSKLANGDADENNKLLRHAIADLTRRRIICKSKRPPLGGRPYRLNESYSYTLAKLAQQQKYQEAIAFKTKLDAVFRRGETMKVPYVLDDGSVMALTNMNASGRVRLVPTDVPHIPMGFEPGNYESRKYPKSYYHFGIEVVMTDRYQYNEEIEVLNMAAEAGPPLEGPQGELPQWIDFFGQRDVKRWTRVLGAFCFVYATRGLLTNEGICSALKPVLEEFEAQMIIDWGKNSGVLKDSGQGMGVMVGEWWWLAVPWQLRQHLVSKE
ncbi:hypothetical protein B0T10DRAFT_282465 [Thelonectria olida]|uniref:C2H2-type domain-containing protein n=1 Tax=Thelonectria olida TaxID=1576542 RepID=A0A9P8W7Z2_9HYPO|nr:hypothetical protein B0T10DRAFT_282465 [Thelonectria olida]